MLWRGGVGFSRVDPFEQQLQLGRVELLTLGAKNPLDEQIHLFSEKLILQSQLLVVGLKLADL